MDVFTRRSIARSLQIFPPPSFPAAFSFWARLVSRRREEGEPQKRLFSGKPLKFPPLYPAATTGRRHRRRAPPSAWVSLTPRLFARIDSGWGEARKSVFIQELRRTTEMGRDWNRTIFNRSARLLCPPCPVARTSCPPPSPLSPTLLHIANRIRSVLDIPRNSACLAPSVLSWATLNTLPRFILANKSRGIPRSPK